MHRSEFRLTLAEYDPAPTSEFQNHYHWDAKVDSAGFAGTSSFITSQLEVENLLSQLATLDATLLVQTEWQSGENTEPHLRLRLRPNGHTGRLVVEVGLADPVQETGLVRRVTAVFGTMPNTFREFVRSLHSAITRPVEGVQIVLCSDREADV